ncbi:hypothetical protein Tco_1096955 [Tanacetum coccineum]
MFATGDKVQEIVRFPSELLIKDNKKTEAYRDYVDEFQGLDVLMIQPPPVVSTQGTHRTLSAPKPPKPRSTPHKLKGEVVGELSEPKKPLRIKFKAKQPEYEKQVVVVVVQDAILTEEVEKILEGYNEEVDTFDDTIMLSQENPRTRLEPWSNKENPEKIVHDDENDNDDHALTRKKILGSSKTRNEQMQTPIPTPPKSPRINLSSDKAPLQELTDTHATTSEVVRKRLKEKSKKTSAPLDTFRPKASRMRDQDNHPDDNPEGEKSCKRQKTTKGSSSVNVITSSNQTSSSKLTTVQKSKIHTLQPPIQAFDGWPTVQEIDDDENVYEEATTEFLTEIQGKKWVPTTVDLHKMKFSHNDILKSQCKTGAEYEYHLQQIENYMKNQIVWESRQEDKTHDLKSAEKMGSQGIEIYQMKVNLTTPTITIPGIKTIPPYPVIGDPFVGIIYENSKKERRAMDIDELQKFSDATLKRVLRKISAINVED